MVLVLLYRLIIYNNGTCFLEKKKHIWHRQTSTNQFTRSNHMWEKLHVKSSTCCYIQWKIKYDQDDMNIALDNALQLPYSL